ncbi:MAG: hypothetical protein HYZ74_06195, partial [Elusimicrobia bacterium]|nr:hypothetical protein [Elusimicrobiota bacterium]
MSEEPRSGRLGAILVAAAVGGSAVAVLSWHLMSGRGADQQLDTSGFDISAAPDSTRRPAAASGAAAQGPASSLGMVKGDAGMRVVSPGSGPSRSSPGAPSGASAKEKAALNAREVAMRNEKF